MATQFPPKKNTAFTLYFTLYKNDGTIIANPGTITKKVSIDGAAVADIAAAVTEEDTTYGQCSVVLSASEMGGDAIWVYIKDDTTGCVPFTCTIYTSSYTQDDLGNDSTAIHNHINDIHDTDIPAIKTVLDNVHDTDLPAVKTVLDDLHNTDLPAVKTDTAAIKTATDKIGTITNTGGTATLGAILGDFANSALVTRVADLHTDVADVHTDVADVHTDIATAITAIGDVHATDLPAVMTMLTDIHATDLPAVKTQTQDIHDTLDAVHTDVDAILADTNELELDWKNGGRLDLLLDNAQVAGAGAVTWTYTVTDGADPIANVHVWVSTDAAGTNIIASGDTNASGVATFYLDAGTYYIWSSKEGYTFTNPDTEVVS